MRVRFYWETNRKDIIQRIKDRFKVHGITVNYESIVDITDEELNLLRKCEDKGYIQIREILNK